MPLHELMTELLEEAPRKAYFKQVGITAAPPPTKK
jgi:hypothetical protein